MLFALPAISLGWSSGVLRAAAPAEGLAEFLETHCTACHSDDEPEAGLSLESLRLELTTDAVAARWERVFDKVARGEMPPADADPPPRAARDAFTAALRVELHAASLARQQRQGRALSRRLNRIEFENTLRDLLATPVHVVALLPEDGSAGGFDTVADGLQISATHLVQYQRAIDAAFAAALPPGPPRVLRETVTGRDWYDRVHPNIRRFADKSYLIEEDVGVLYHQDPPHTDLDIFSRERPQSPGLYRVKLTAGTRNTAGRPLPLRFIWQGMRADAKLPHLIDYRDVPAGGPHEIELLVDVPPAYVDQYNISVQTVTLPQIPRHDAVQPPPPDHAKEPALVIYKYEIEGPLGGWPTPGYQRLFGDSPLAPRSVAAALAQGETPAAVDWSQWRPEQFAADPLVPVAADPQADARRLIADFLPRAFRRPVEAELIDYYVAFADTRLDRGLDFGEALLATYKAILCSPHFLLLMAPACELDDHALAERLSYFLWNTQPDETLRAVADAGELRERATLAAQVERMLSDPRSRQFVRNFTGQWLGLRKVLDMAPDEVYLEYDYELAWTLAPESEHFFAEVLAHDLSVKEFVDSRWTFLNARLARHYGVADVHGFEMRKVALAPEHRRGGVLTHAGILKLTTNGSYTSPIKRGVWLLEQIVGQPPDPPPPNVAAIEPDIRGAVTLREQIEKHRTIASCNACHGQIDPPGFALENYDVLGGYRERYRAPSGAKGKIELVSLENYPQLKKVYVAAAVDPTGVTAMGEAFDGLPAYKQILLRDPDQLARALAGKLLVYGTGAELQFADRAAIEEIVSLVRERNYGLRRLIHEIVASPVFLHK